MLHQVGVSFDLASDIFDLSVSFQLVTFSIQIYFHYSLKCLLASRLELCTLMYYCGLDPVTAAFLSASFDVKIIIIIHQIMVYTTSIHPYLGHL